MGALMANVSHMSTAAMAVSQRTPLRKRWMLVDNGIRVSVFVSIGSKLKIAKRLAMLVSTSY